ARPGQVLEMEEGGARVRVAPGRLIAGNGGVRIPRGPGTLQPALTGVAERTLLLALGIALGMAGGLSLAYPGVGPVVAGVLMLLASSVLDCSDGELARLSHSESRLGHWMDITGDTAVHLALLAGIGARIA